MRNIEEVLVEKGYRVTEDGKLLNPKGVEIGKGISSTGYFKSSTRLAGGHRRFFVHRLQAYQKYGEALYQKGTVVRHKDGVPTNNSWENILIGSESDNRMDIPSDIRVKLAVHAASFLKKYDNTKVREFYESCKSYRDTMINFGISSKGTLHYILNSDNR